MFVAAAAAAAAVAAAAAAAAAAATAVADAADADDEASAGTKQIGNKRAEFYLFYTDWCPYSKKVLPIWDKIQARFNGEVNESGYVLDYI